MPTSRSSLSATIAAGVAAALIAGCSPVSPGAGALPMPSHTMPRTPRALPPQNLYVLNGTSTGTITAYALPLSSKSKPVARIDDTAGGNIVVFARARDGKMLVANCIATCGGTGKDAIEIYRPMKPGSVQIQPIAAVTRGISYPVSLATDRQGNLFAGNNNGTVTEYAPPYTGGPSAKLVVNGIPQSMAVDSVGNLIVATCIATCQAGTQPDAVLIFAPPFRNRSVPEQTITNAVRAPWAIVLDAANNLFLSNTPTPKHGSVAVYPIPYGTPKPVRSVSGAPQALALDASGDLFVANCAASCGFRKRPPDTVLEYAPPYTAAPVVVDSSAGGLLRPQALAVDRAQNLIVANGYNNNLTVYAPPYAGNLKATVTSGIDGPLQLIAAP